MATPASAAPGVAARTPYRVTLHQMECCNCNHGCGCQFAGYPDRGNCEFLIGFEIMDGKFGTVPLAGARGTLVRVALGEAGAGLALCRRRRSR